MAITEVNSLMKFKDKDGNITAIYPSTKIGNVEGLNELIRNQTITTTGDGSAYIATIEGISELTTGVSFVMIPHVESTSSNPTIDVNGLGAIRIRRGLSTNTSTTTAGASDSWLSAGKPIRITYDGLFWIADFPRPSATDLMGTVPIESGGTGATTAADARTNLGAVSMVNKTFTISAANWDSNTVSMLFINQGITSSSTLIVSPDPSCHEAYGEAGVYCSGQEDTTTGTSDQSCRLTFTCDSTPSEDLTVNVVILT